MVAVISVVFLLLFVVLFYITYGYGLSLRKAAIFNGWNDLKEAQLELQKDGKLSNNYGHDYVFICTNNIVIGSTNYQCAIAVETERFNGEGILTVATNQVLIWLDKKRGPKIIGIPPNYNPPIFLSSF
ncbi:MAG TPA: hypothetical protein VHY30_10530 [Verrucomicrobiae bacterium]|nr:hypothetical protein [Verrucomicrobiae bacterium]